MKSYRKGKEKVVRRVKMSLNAKAGTVYAAKSVGKKRNETKKQSVGQ